MGAQREARRLRAEVESFREQGKDGSSGDTGNQRKREIAPFENDIEEDSYTAVNFPNKASDDKTSSGGEEEKGER